MKIETEDQKMCYILGYLQALAEQHAREFDLDVSEVKKEILKGALNKEGLPL